MAYQSGLHLVQLLGGKDTYAVKIISLKRLRHQPGFTRMEKRCDARGGWGSSLVWGVIIQDSSLVGARGWRRCRLHQEIEILLSLMLGRVVPKGTGAFCDLKM